VDTFLEGEWIGKINAATLASVAIPSLGIEKISAKIIMIDPVVDPGSGLFRVRLLIPNPNMSIRSGLPAKVRFETQP
jgi:multidrug efflux pump subunit AcrA (membrane-fusion protein)